MEQDKACARPTPLPPPHTHRIQLTPGTPPFTMLGKQREQTVCHYLGALLGAQLRRITHTTRWPVRTTY